MIRHTTCILPAKDGGHDWSIMDEGGAVVVRGHDDDLTAARKSSWRACTLAEAGPQEAIDSVAAETVASLTTMPRPIDFSLPGRAGFWLLPPPSPSRAAS